MARAADVPLAADLSSARRKGKTVPVKPAIDESCAERPVTIDAALRQERGQIHVLDDHDHDHETREVVGGQLSSTLAGNKNT